MSLCKLPVNVFREFVRGLPGSWFSLSAKRESQVNWSFLLLITHTVCCFGVGYANDYGDSGDFWDSFFWGGAAADYGDYGDFGSLRSRAFLLTTKITKGAKHIGPAYRAVLIMVKDRKARNRRDCAATCNRNVFRRLRAAA